MQTKIIVFCMDAQSYPVVVSNISPVRSQLLSVLRSKGYDTKRIEFLFDGSFIKEETIEELKIKQGDLLDCIYRASTFNKELLQ